MTASAIDRGIPAVLQAATPLSVQAVPGPADRAWFVARVAAGSAYDPVGREGLAWRVAHAALPDPADRWRVDVGREWVVFTAACSPSDAQACATELATALTAPAFLPDSVAGAAAAQREALQSSDPTWLADELFTCAVYEGHRYGHPVAGRAGVLDVLTDADVRRFHSEHYLRSTVRVGVGGAVDEAVRASLMERLLALPSGIPPDLALFDPPTHTAGTSLAVDGSAATSAVRIGVPARISWADPDGAALWLGLAVLRDELGAPVELPSPASERTFEDVLIAVPPDRDAATAWTVAQRWAREGAAADRVEVLRERLAGEPLDPVEALVMGEPFRQRLARSTPAEVNAAIAAHVDAEAWSIVTVGTVLEGAWPPPRHLTTEGLFR